MDFECDDGFYGKVVLFHVQGCDILYIRPQRSNAQSSTSSSTFLFPQRSFPFKGHFFSSVRAASAMLSSQPGCNRLLGAILLALFLGVAFARPLERYPFPSKALGLVVRQQTATPSNAPGTASNAPTGSSRTQTVAGTRSTTASPSSTPATSRTSSTTPSTAVTTSARTSAAPSSNVSASGTSTHPIGLSTLPSSASAASATATNTNSPRSADIFSADSPYHSYAIAVLVVVVVFGTLLLVLFIRFIIQCFGKEPKSEPVATNPGHGAWRYPSRDSDLYSAVPVPSSPNATQTPRDTRHKDISDADMSERHGFLSTDSVTLYPASKSEEVPARYNDDEPEYPNRMRSFSASSGSGSQAAVPFVSRRPATMSFLHSPSATHPALVIDPGSDAGHSDEVQASNLRAVPEEPAAAPNTTSGLLLARAGHSDLYRQQTLNSVRTDLSRAASTASAYSQQSVYSSVPPVPALPAQHARPSRTQLSPDVSAALTSMQRSRNGSIDSLHTFKSTAPPTEEGTAAPSAFPRERRGRAAWGGRAPSSIHGPDLYFGNP